MTRPDPRSTSHDPRASGPRPPFPAETQEAPALERPMQPSPDYGLHSYRGLGRLTDRVALITGGDSGIGRAVALAFAREGADVAFCCLEEEEQDAEETREAIEESGRRAYMAAGDLADPEFIRRFVSAVYAEFGRLDIVVNNAAYQSKALDAFEELQLERLERTVRVNLIAPFLLVREALPHLKAGATILNVSSIEAYEPSPEILDYSTTKGALVTFTKGLAAALIDRGIRVNCVAPGPVWTPLVQQSLRAEELEQFGADFPMKRPAQPAELAPAFVFLASDESRYVNGEVIAVTGGSPLP